MAEEGREKEVVALMTLHTTIINQGVANAALDFYEQGSFSREEALCQSGLTEKSFSRHMRQRRQQRKAEFRMGKRR